MLCSLTCLCVGLVVPKAARGEEELRIALVDRRPSITVGGVALAVFAGDSGDVLARFEADTDLKFSMKAGRLSVDSPKVNLKGAKRVLIEAQDAVRVEKGVYFGRIEITADPGQATRLIAINRLPLETYLLGIVGSEMSPAWPLEALKAQAVAARTYAMQRRAMMRAAGRPYDLASSVISQVYKGAERIRPPVIEAVKQTRGEVMSYRHDLIEALFHSTCGGQTVSAEEAFGGQVAYLTPQPCAWCKASDRYRWNISFSLAEVAKRMKSAGLAKGNLTTVERVLGAKTVSIRDARGRHSVEPRALRKALGFSTLFSERFSAHTRGNKVQFEGLGFGHGVGMCQWGAHGQASEGRTYRDILMHYYPSTRIKRLY